MKRPWAYVCATNDTNSKTLRGYCRKIFQCGYVPVCPRLQDGQFIVLENPDERHAFNEIVRDMPYAYTQEDQPDVRPSRT